MSIKLSVWCCEKGIFIIQRPKMSTLFCPVKTSVRVRANRLIICFDYRENELCIKVFKTTWTNNWICMRRQFGRPTFKLSPTPSVDCAVTMLKRIHSSLRWSINYTEWICTTIGKHSRPPADSPKHQHNNPPLTASLRLIPSEDGSFLLAERILGKRQTMKDDNCPRFSGSGFYLGLSRGEEGRWCLG